MGLIWWKHKWCRLMLHLQKCHLHHHSSQGTSRAHRKRPWISVTTTNLPFARCQKLAQHQLLPHHQWRHLQRGRRLQHGRHLSVPLPGNPTTSRKKNYTFGCAEDNVEEETGERCENHQERQEIQGTQCDEKNNCQSCICPHSKKATQRKERNRRRCQTRRHHNDRNTVEAIVSLARTNGQSFFTDCCDAQKKPVHVQLWTEFSGAGTPEFALKALASQVPEHLSMQVMSQCDWSPTAQTCCINNSDKDTHLFSDIADIMSEEMKARAERRVAVEVAWFYFHMWCVVFFFSLHLYIYIYCMIFLALWDIKYFDATKT